MLVIQTHEEFTSHLNKEPVVSPWHTITPEQVKHFTIATIDLGHEEPGSALSESFSNSTIIPDYLVLSLIPFFWTQMVDVQNLTMQVNYGIEHLKFGHAVVTGSELRCQGSLSAIANLRGITKATFSIQLDIKGESEPALTGEIIFLCHFKTDNS